MSLLSDIGAAAAFVVSAYSLYQTTLRRASLKVFVSPVIRYASPYQNSNFEAFAVPVTIANEGARTGTIVTMDLQVRAPERDVIKRFYSADIGQWSIERNRSGDFRPFAPIVLAGRTSHTETILFHARSDEPVMQIVDKEGTVLDATADEPGPSRYFERLAIAAAKTWTFAPADSEEQRKMLVRFYFTRAGTTARGNSVQ